MSDNDGVRSLAETIEAEGRPYDQNIGGVPASELVSGPPADDKKAARKTVDDNQGKDGS